MAYNVKGITVKINGDTTGLQKAISQVKAQTSGLDKTMSTLKKSMQFNSNDYSSLSTYQKLVQDKMSNLSKQVQVYQKAISQMPSTEKEWTAAVTNNRNKLADLSEELSINKTVIDGYKTTIKNNNAEISTWKTKQSEIKSELKTSKSEVSNLAKSLQSAEKEYTSSTNSIAKYNGKLQEAKNKLSEFKALNTDEAGTRYTSGIKTLTTNVEKYSTKLEEAKRKLNDFQSFNKSGDTNSSTFKKLTSDVENYSTKLAEAKQKLADFQSSGVYETNSAYKSSTIKKLTSDVEEYSNKLAEAEAKQTASKEKITSASEKYNKALEEYNQLQTTSNEKMAKASTAIDTLKTKNTDLKGAVNELEDANKGLSTEIDETKTRIDTLGNSFEECQQKTATMEANSLALKNEMEGLRDKIISTNEKGLKWYTTLGNISDKLDLVSQKTQLLSGVSAGILAGATVSAISFEDAWTGVTKTVDGTPKQMEAINDGIKNLATTTASSYQDIASYAELAGQMGIPTDSIIGFTETITKLGDTTNLVGEEAAQEISKIANIMVTDGEKTNDYFSRMGSTIVDLGNNFATTESDITAMTKKMATAAKQSGMTTSDVLGISAALSSLGIEADAGGSSMSKMFKRINLAVAEGNEDLSAFAEVSGMTAEEFAQAWETDAADAFQKFVEGIGKSDNVTQTLSDLGITEVRLSNAMGALAQNSDLLKDALETSSSAWEDNTAMTKEAEKRYATLKSQLSQTWEAIKQAGNELGQALTPSLSKILDVVKDLALGFANLDDSTQETIAKMLLVGAAVSPTAKILSKLASGGQSVIKMFFGLNSGATQIARGMGILGVHASNTGEELGTLGQMAYKLTSALSGGTNSLKLVSEGAELSETSIAGLATGMKTTSSTMGGAIPIIAKVGSALGVMAGVAAVGYAEVKILTSKFKKAQEEMVNYMAKNDEIYASNLEVIDSFDEYNSSMEETIENFSNLYSDYASQTENAQPYIDTIKDLAWVQDKTTYETAELQAAIDNLNEIYPDLGLKIDETTGKLTDEEGTTIDNVTALDEYIKKVQEASKTELMTDLIKEYTKAMNEQKSKLKEVTTTYDELSEKIQRVREEQRKANEEGDSEKVVELQAELEQLTKDLGETSTEFKKLRKQMQETNESYLDQMNELETGGFTTIGTTMKETLQGLIDDATNAGIQIPTSLTQGIMDGSASYEEAKAYISSMMTFQDLETAAGETGLAIPYDMALGIMSNAGSITEATSMMNNLIKFNEAIAKAGLAGVEIPQDLATQVANGQITVKEAVAQLENGINDEVDKGSEKTKKKVKDTLKEVEDAPSGISTGKYGAFAQSIYNSMAPALNSVLDLINSVLNGASKASTASYSIHTGGSNYASDKAISNASAGATRSLVQSVGDYITPRITTPQDIVSSVNTSRMLSASASGSSYSNGSSDMSVSKKLDLLINKLENIQMTINLQPQELDGNVVADSVQETIAIRQMLTNYGKGVA